MSKQETVKNQHYIQQMLMRNFVISDKKNLAINI